MPDHTWTTSGSPISPSFSRSPWSATWSTSSKLWIAENYSKEAIQPKKDPNLTSHLTMCSRDAFWPAEWLRLLCVPHAWKTWNKNMVGNQVPDEILLCGVKTLPYVIECFDFPVALEVMWNPASSTIKIKYDGDLLARQMDRSQTGCHIQGFMLFSKAHGLLVKW